MAKELRQLWKDAKDRQKKTLDMSKVSTKTKLGPALDKFQELVDAHDKLADKLQKNPDEAKEKKAKDAVKAAAKVALNACVDYIKSLQQIVKHSDNPTRDAADELLTVLTYHISDRLVKATKGEF